MSDLNPPGGTDKLLAAVSMPAAVEPRDGSGDPAPPCVRVDPQPPPPKQPATSPEIDAAPGVSADFDVDDAVVDALPPGAGASLFVPEIPGPPDASWSLTSGFDLDDDRDG